MPSPEKNGFLQRRSEERPDLTLSRGGLYTDRGLSAEEQLERDIRSWGARGKVNGNGVYASKACADIAQESRFPHRVPARILREAMDGGATVAWALELGALFDKYVRAKAAEMGISDQPRVA